jgi:hypothetical protein
MLLESYRLEIFNNKCMPGAETVNCFAHLDQNVSAVLPYLNSVLGGFEYVQDPPAVTFKAHGKLITDAGLPSTLSKTRRRLAKSSIGSNAKSTKPGKTGTASCPVRRAHPGPRSSKSSNCCPKQIAASAANPPAWFSPPDWRKG